MASDKPESITVEIGGEPLRLLAELEAVAAGWAKQNDATPQTASQIIEMAIRRLHASMTDQASEILSDHLRDQYEAETERRRGAKVH